MRVSDCDTPALLLDIEAVDRNIKKMGDYFRGKQSTLRAHTKIHKSPFIAKKQIEAGSRGITCAKLGEAEIMAQSGIEDILIANEITSDYKVNKLARLARYCNIKVAVDNLQNAKQLSRAAENVGSTIGVLVDLNLGASTGLDGILDRCGVPPGRSAVDLAKEVAKQKNLEFKGLMGYEGSIFNFQSLKEIDSDTRANLCKKALRLLVETKELVEDSGLNVETVSGGGTMTYKIVAEFPGLTEVQAGMYALMDATYHRFGMDFEFGLSIMTRVVSRPRAEKVILDAGGTAVSTDAGLPWVKNRHVDLTVTEVNAEHTHVVSKGGVATDLDVGDMVELLPTNVDTTTCLHDSYIVARNGDIDMILGIPVRGKFQ